MDFDFDQSVRVLRNTPSVLRALLSDASEPWVRGNYGPNTFSPLDVVGHLIHGERTDWITRVRIILEQGPDRPFDPFDQTAAYDESMGTTIGEVLDLFETLRAENVASLQALAPTPEQLDRQGTHPALGTVTLRQLLATWTVHDLHHVAQICKAMAHQYRDAVGPWGAYLSILRQPVAAPAR
jgi:hypothetical protein